MEEGNAAEEVVGAEVGARAAAAEETDGAEGATWEEAAEGVEGPKGAEGPEGAEGALKWDESEIDYLFVTAIFQALLTMDYLAMALNCDLPTTNELENIQPVPYKLHSHHQWFKSIKMVLCQAKI